MGTFSATCPVCQKNPAEATHIESAVMSTGGSMHESMHTDSAVYFRCDNCGHFVLTSCDRDDLKSILQRKKIKPAHLSALLREQTIRRLPPYWLQCDNDPYGPINWTLPLAPIALDELMQRWPRTVLEKLDRALSNAAAASPLAGSTVNLTSFDTSIAFAESPSEADYIRNALRDQGFIASVVGNSAEMVLTPHGWARVHGLTYGKSSRENPVFVAMWFGGDDERRAMDEAFNDGIWLAVKDAGYDVTRADIAQHNDWIMDKVLGDIRRAPFVVADFTGHRNGVYLEAGFARGLGLSVINTCRKSDLEKAHFDTAQLNHVVWETPAELREKLYHRILGTIGEGPFPVAK